MENETIYDKFKAVLKFSTGKSPSVYEHLLKILCFIHVEIPKDPYENFERISTYIKKFTKEFYNEKKSHHSTLINPVISCTTSDSLLSKKFENIQGIDQILTEKECFLIDNDILAMGGIILDDYETLKLQVALLKLNTLVNSKFIRFWGKLLGFNKDYYICEIRREDINSNVKEDNYDFETANEPYEGQSIFDYWYFSDITNIEWVKLEEFNLSKVTDIVELKYILTGNPRRYLKNGCCFRGTEEQYLRALVDKISAATVVDCKAITQSNLDYTSSTSISESFQLQNAADLDYWVYKRKLGEITDNSDSRINSVESFDKTAYLTSDNNSFGNKVKTLKEDYYLGYPTWSIRQIPNHKVKGNEKSPQYFYILKSLKWPGAVTIYDGKYTSSFYMGNGVQASQEITPNLIPSNIMNEPDEPAEQLEPQPGTSLDGKSHNYVD